MEILENELTILIQNLKDKSDFKTILKNLKSIYPFSKYEFIISKLLADKVLTYNQYLNLRDEYIERNLFLYVFELTGPRSFGDTWAFSHLKSIEPDLLKAMKKYDENYRGEYDMLLKYNDKIIKIEVKASRAVDKDKNDEPLYQKALSSISNAKFLMNFQQLKPSCCDIFLWIMVYRDTIRYFVIKNTDIYTHADFTPQHRNETTENRNKNYNKSEIFEGQIMITNTNINSILKYETKAKNLKDKIIYEFEK